MKIGIIDDDTQFSQVIKHKIEENTCFSKSSIDVFNNDFKSLQLKDYDYLFIDILLMQDNGITDYSLVIAPVVAELCTTSVALSAPPNSYQNNSQS